MERKLQERMVGAGVLILALVIVGPMILDGGSGGPDDEVQVPGQRPDEIRTQTFQLNERVPPPAPKPVPATAMPKGVVTTPAVKPVEPPRQPPPPSPARLDAGPAGPAVPVARPPVAAPAPAPEVARGREPAQAAVPSRSGAEVARPATAGGSFLVQVGTFGQKDNAERLVKTLEGRGFAAFVSAASRDGKTLYRVRVGPPGTREAARSLAGRLAAAGQSGQVVTQ